MPFDMDTRIVGRMLALRLAMLTAALNFAENYDPAQ